MSKAKGVSKYIEFKLQVPYLRKQQMDKGGKVILDSLLSYELISGEGKLLKAALKFGRANVFGLSMWRWYGL